MIPAASGRAATAASWAARATVVFTPTPHRRSDPRPPTAPSTVSGATVVARPRPITSTTGSTRAHVGRPGVDAGHQQGPTATSSGPDGHLQAGTDAGGEGARPGRQGQHEDRDREARRPRLDRRVPEHVLQLHHQQEEHPAEGGVHGGRHEVGGPELGGGEDRRAAASDGRCAARPPRRRRSSPTPPRSSPTRSPPPQPSSPAAMSPQLRPPSARAIRAPPGRRRAGRRRDRATRARAGPRPPRRTPRGAG